MLRDEAGAVEQTEAAVRRLARMNVPGGKHLNAGLRGIFFSIGYLAWFAGPAVFVATTAFVLGMLARRQFFPTTRSSLLEPGER